jgi:hypothetical protein
MMADDGYQGYQGARPRTRTRTSRVPSPSTLFPPGPGTRDGAYLATRWVVAFAHAVGNNVGTLRVNDIDAGVATAAVVQTVATDALSGEVSLAYGDLCESVSFDPTTASEGAIRDLIATLPGVCVHAYLSLPLPVSVCTR